MHFGLNFKWQNSVVSSDTIMFTYVDPKSYVGPIVQGWPPDKNRSVENYMSGNCIDSPMFQRWGHKVGILRYNLSIFSFYFILGVFSIRPSQDKLTNKTLIVIVQSRPSAFIVRQSCRETWGKLGNYCP